ncbi:MAG: glutathione S-transferase family protein [Alphaproteobacteria bacterium]|nr:glutathione S-transferase family protein [Alphaproteobacteria bacterium]
MYTLYVRRGTGSIAPQIVLEELGWPHRVAWIDRDAASEPAYLAINPTGKIPSLRLGDGTVIFESAAIFIHLAACDPTNRLAPAIGTPGHARFLQWMVFLSANVYETYSRGYYPQRHTATGDAGAPGVKAQAFADATRQMGVIESGLSPYLIGNQSSAADYYLYMLTTWHQPSPAHLYERYPKLKTLCATIASRPAVAKVLAMNN